MKKCVITGVISFLMGALVTVGVGLGIAEVAERLPDGRKEDESKDYAD